MIDILIDARGLSRLGTAFTVVLKHEKHKWLRTILCGKLSTNRAEMKAVEYALASIQEDQRNQLIRIKSTGKFAALMLRQKEDGEWERTSNDSLVDFVRTQWRDYANISIDTSTEDEVTALREVTDNSLKTGEMIFVR